VIVFELLFLVLALVTLVTLLAAAVRQLTGRRGDARRLLLRLLGGVVLYLSAVVTVTIVQPRKEYRIGDVQCFDDWCIAVEGVQQSQDPAGPYEVRLRLENRSRGTPMGERGTVVYLTDAQGRRHDPLPDPAEVSFDARLEPGQSVVTTRYFRLPQDATGLGLVYTHEGGFPIAWLVLTEGGWFADPPIVWLD
jgi:hypothetical protein